MAAAIPAAIGAGSSLIGGIAGKGQAKRQEKMAREQMAQMKPLIDALIQGRVTSLKEGRGMLDMSKPWMKQGAEGLQGLTDFWKPAMSGNRSAMDMFLSPERRAINQGYQATSDTLTRFAPRGGGRVSSMAQADTARQGRLSDLTFGARREAAGQTQGLMQALAQLGLGGSQTGLGAIGGGDTSGIFNMLSNQQNRAMQAGQASNNAWGSAGSALGQLLGGFKMFGGAGYGSSGD